MRKLSRVVLKLSGEAFGGERGHGMDPETFRRIAGEVLEVHEGGVQVGIVVGGGNWFRGAKSAGDGLHRVTADQIGMIATVVNGMALRDYLEESGGQATVMSAVPVPGVVQRFDRGQAVRELEAGRIVVLVAGTGNPYFTTDSAAALRALQLDADAMLKGTKVDGVFDSDPAKNPEATRYAQLTYQEVLTRQLAVMDLSAVALCAERGMPVVVFNMRTKGALAKVVAGEDVGTRIDPG